MLSRLSTFLPYLSDFSGDEIKINFVIPVTGATALNMLSFEGLITFLAFFISLECLILPVELIVLSAEVLDNLSSSAISVDEGVVNMLERYSPKKLSYAYLRDAFSRIFFALARSWHNCGSLLWSPLFL